MRKYVGRERDEKRFYIYTVYILQYTSTNVSVCEVKKKEEETRRPRGKNRLRVKIKTKRERRKRERARDAAAENDVRETVRDKSPQRRRRN